MEEEISLLDLWQMLKKHLRIIVKMTLVGGFLAGFYSFLLATPIYQASTDILVNRSADSRDNNLFAQDINASLQLINTYSDVIRNDVVLKPVVRTLGTRETAEELREKITVESKNNSQVFTIAVKDENPSRAAHIANVVAKEFNHQIKKMMKIDNVTIISKATTPRHAVSPRKALNLLVGLVVGMGIGLAIAFIRELADNTVKSEDFITEELGWTSLGQVARFSSSDLKVKRTASNDVKPNLGQVDDKSHGRIQRSRRDRM